MKIIIIIMGLFVTNIFSQAVYQRVENPTEFMLDQYKLKKQNDSSYKFNPLNIGNQWQYRDFEGKLYIKQVVKDTIINNLRYYKVEYTNVPTTIERNANNAVYLYDAENFDSDTSTVELLCDSLNIPVDSSYQSYRYSTLYGFDPMPFTTRLKDRFLAIIPMFDDTVLAVEIENWTQDGWLETTEVWAENYGLIDIMPEGNHLFLSGSVIDSISYGTITGLEWKGGSSNPNKTTLNENYPNPFNSQTHITFSLQEPSNGSLRIYNISGEMIKVYLFDQSNGKGINFKWDGRSSRGDDVASGIYFYRLTVSGYTYTRKMLLIR